MATILLGLDIGSSSVKVSLIDAASGECVCSAFCPESEAPIISAKSGWAEQNPESWWEYAKVAQEKALRQGRLLGKDVAAVGVSYQMHGLVCVDKQLRVLRPAIIWCDSRAVSYGERAFGDLGSERCLAHLLNSPGNFTAAKLAWVRENEPDVFCRIYKVMLPGDYIVMRLSGDVTTTVSGLSEGVFWDFIEDAPAQFLLDYYGIPASMLADVVPTFGEQCAVSAAAAAELGLREGTPITYRAGDQPNNALSLGVFEPGEVAATAGTSGVVYGVMGSVGCDPLSRVNAFAHVNHSSSAPRIGQLLCINGTGILNAWIRRNVCGDLDYAAMNSLAAHAPIGSDRLCIMPFGNGAERMLQNAEPGCSIHGLNFNIHSRAHLLRAAQEGIVFSFCYGMEIMQQMGMPLHTIHAGRANMMLSPLFCEALANTSGATIELYDTDGAAGAARGAGLGAGLLRSREEAFGSLRRCGRVSPEQSLSQQYRAAYEQWKGVLKKVSEECGD